MHRCSTALAEEALSTYTGHSDPVYCVHWNRRHPDVFLSTSADWTVKLWLSGRSQVRDSLGGHTCDLATEGLSNKSLWQPPGPIKIDTQLM